MPRLEAIVWAACCVSGALSFALFVLVVFAAAGDVADDNLAPRFIFVYFWLRVPILSACSATFGRC